MAQPNSSKKPKSAAARKRFEFTPRADFGLGELYSRMVFWLKVFLPALAVALLLAIMVWPKLVENDARFQIEPKNIAEQAPVSSIILGPRYVGRTKDGTAYAVKAQAAAPAPSDPDAINLQNPELVLENAGKTSLSMRADRATYWRSRNGMTAQGKIAVTTGTGQQIFTETAHADFAKGVVWGDGPISGTGPEGKFAAEGFEAGRENNSVKLKGRVQMTLQPRTPGRNLAKPAQG